MSSTNAAMRCVFAACLFLVAGFAGAQDAPQHLGLCATCHGERGIATMPDVPHLAGQNLAYLRDAIEQYRSGKRDVAVMRAAVGSLKAAEIDEILRWYAQQKPQDRVTQ